MKKNALFAIILLMFTVILYHAALLWGANDAVAAGITTIVLLFVTIGTGSAPNPAISAAAAIAFVVALIIAIATAVATVAGVAYTHIVATIIATAAGIAALLAVIVAATNEDETVNARDWRDGSVYIIEATAIGGALIVRSAIWSAAITVTGVVVLLAIKWLAQDATATVEDKTH